MRIEDLTLFISLANTRNISSTARVHGLSQSAVSKVLQRLEAHFEIPLVERSREGLRLTSAGAMLHAKALQVCGAVDSLNADIVAHRATLRGQVRIGTYLPMFTATLLPLVRKMHTESPECHLTISVQISSRLISDVVDGTLDLALCVSAEKLAAPLVSERLGPESYSFVCSSKHPFLREGASLEALARARWLLPAHPVAMRREVDAYFQQQLACELDIAIETDVSTSLLADLVQSTDLVTAFTAQTLKHMDSKASRSAFCVVHRVPSESEVLLVYRRGTVLTPGARRMRELVHEAFASQLPQVRRSPARQ